jgi:hypothetical protein
MGFDLGGIHQHGGSATSIGSATSPRRPTPGRGSAACLHFLPGKLLVESEAQRRQEHPYNDDQQNLFQTKHLIESPQKVTDTLK